MNPHSIAHPVHAPGLRALAARLARRASRVTIDPCLWGVLAFSLLAALPLAGPSYFFNAHDAPHTVFFLTEFDAALRDGVWYPAWGTDQALGYGYPTFTLYSPLAYFAAEGIHLLGATKVAAVKWTWALATVGAGLAMYAYGRRVLGRGPGLLAAVVYVYVPYHLLDIYVRAALAEYAAFVWMPLALLAFHNLAERGTARRVGLAGLAYGALLMTHHLTALAFTPVLAAYVLWRLLAGSSRPLHARLPSLAGRAAAALAGAVLGLGLAAALILPGALERGYIQEWQWWQAGYDYSRHFVYPFQLFSSFWGYTPALPGPNDGMSLQLGAVPVVLALSAIVGLARRPAGSRGWVVFYAAASVLLVLLMLPLSAPVWRLLPIAAFVQFPWRLLALTAVTLAVLSGLAVGRQPAAGEAQPAPVGAEGGEKRRMSLMPWLLCALAVVAGYPYTQPEYTPVPDSAEGPLLVLQFEQKYPDMIGMTHWTQEQPRTSPLVAQYEAGEPLVTAEALAPGAQVEMIRTAGASDELWVRSETGTALRFYTYYYPGWRVRVDDRWLPDAALRPDPPYGLLTVDVPPGEHHVLLRWGDTPVRAAGKGISLASLILSLALVVWRRPR